MVLVDLKGEHDFDCKNTIQGHSCEKFQKSILELVSRSVFLYHSIALTCKGELDTALF